MSSPVSAAMTSIRSPPETAPGEVLEGDETALPLLVELAVPVADDASHVAHVGQDNAVRNPCQGDSCARASSGATAGLTFRGDVRSRFRPAATRPPPCRAGPPAPAGRGSRKPLTACSSTTSTPRSPSAARISSSTAARGRPRGTPSASRRSSGSSRRLGDDETLLVQSGKPVGVFRTHAGRAESPHRELQPGAEMGHLGRIPSARGPRPDHVRADDRGLVDLHRDAGNPPGHVRDLRGGRAARSRVAGRFSRRTPRRHGGPRRHGRRPAARRHDVRRHGARRRGRRARASTSASRRAISTSGSTTSTRRSTGRSRPATRRKPCRSASARTRWTSSSGFSKRGIVPDVLTDQTSAHDELNGYVPARDLPYEAALAPADRRPRRVPPPVHRVDGRARGGDARAQAARRRDVRLRQQLCAQARRRPASPNAYEIVGFVPLYIRPLFCEGKGPFRWAALSGDPGRHRRDGPRRSRALPGERRAPPLDRHSRAKRVAFQGLPARICWLGYGEREKAGLAFNELVRSGRVKAPIVIGRDHLDCGSVASPNRETEAHEGRQRRDRGLAAPERDAQHGRRRDVGLDPPRRRRRHRLLAARGNGRRGGRDGRGRARGSSACSRRIRAWA